ncbi:MAG TPA: hypothetical protein VIH11_08010 [Gemmatimonadaceae bacterium]
MREAIMKLAANDPAREVLLGIVNTMQVLREVDLQPVLPRIFAYGQILERGGDLKLAADAFETVLRLGDDEYEADLVMDSHMRLGFCRRNLGELSDAEHEYHAAGKIAQRRKESARILRSETGVATVAMMRGNLPKADEMLAAIAVKSAQKGLNEEAAFALHARAVVAQRRGDLKRAVCHAYDALKRAVQPIERDRILGDLGAFFIVLKRYDAALDALTILEATATTEIVRLNARINLVVLAARAGDLDLFTRARASVEDATLASEAEVNYLIESARGFRRFGQQERAIELLTKARELARIQGLNRSLFEAEEMLQSPQLIVAEQASGETPVAVEGPAEDVARELRQMAAALAA